MIADLLENSDKDISRDRESFPPFRIPIIVLASPNDSFEPGVQEGRMIESHVDVAAPETLEIVLYGPRLCLDNGF